MYARGIGALPPLASGISQALPQTITVHDRIQATGAAMSLPPKRDTRSRLCADSEKSGYWAENAVGLALTADCSEIKSAEPQATRLTFLEDFILEHCLHGLRNSSIEIGGIF